MNEKFKIRLLIIICSFLSFVVLAVFIHPLQSSIDVNIRLQITRTTAVYWGYFWFYLLYALWIFTEPLIIKLFSKSDRN